MSLSQLLRILWARKFLFVTLCVTLVMAVAVVSLVLPKKYIAEVAMVVDVDDANPVGERTAYQAQQQTAFIATQIDVIASRNVALKVIEDEHLLEEPYFIDEFAAAGGRPNDADGMRLWLAYQLLDELNVRSSRNGNVIFAQFSSRDPQLAARLANGFSDAYIRTALELKVEPARRKTEWFDKQVQTLRDHYESAQQKVSEYQSKHGVIGVDDAQIDAENARLQELTNQLVMAQSQAYATRARAGQMDEASLLNRPDELSDVMKSPLLQNLKTELARAEGKFADVSQRFDRNHPQYMSAAAELAALQKKVQHELDNARATVARESSISQQQVSNLQRAVETQRQRIIGMRGTQDDYAMLKHEADSARNAYDAAIKRNGETDLESRLDFTNIALLNAAAVPTQPASPRFALNVALAVLFAPLLAAAMILAGELRMRVVHSAEDLREASLGPLLAEVPRPPATLRRSRVTRRGFRRLRTPTRTEPRIEPRVEPGIP